jgi:hypothetical protein
LTTRTQGQSPQDRLESDPRYVRLTISPLEVSISPEEGAEVSKILVSRHRQVLLQAIEVMLHSMTAQYDRFQSGPELRIKTYCQMPRNMRHRPDRFHQPYLHDRALSKTMVAAEVPKPLLALRLINLATKFPTMLGGQEYVEVSLVRWFLSRMGGGTKRKF